MKIKCALLIIAIIFITVISVHRYKEINTNSEVTNIYTYKVGEEIVGGDITISADKFSLLEKKDCKKIIPETEKNDAEDFVLALVEIKLHNNSNNRVETCLTDFVLQSKSWSNAFDLDTYQKLNKFSGVIIALKGNEEKKVLLPYYIYKYQWPKNKWETIQNQKYNLIFQVYPDKHMIIF